MGLRVSERHTIGSVPVQIFIIGLSYEPINKFISVAQYGSEDMR